MRRAGGRPEYAVKSCEETLFTPPSVRAGGRLEELHARGVDSRNWREDRSLSTDVVAVLYNRHTQTCHVEV